MFRRYSTVAALLVLLAAAPLLAQPAAAPPPSQAATFTTFIRGAPIGSEQVTVRSDPDGWVIQMTGRIGDPVNLATNRFEVRYDRDWKPLGLDVAGTLRGQALLIRTTVSAGSATTDVTQAGQQTQKTDAVSADTLLLPNMFFGAYEALALRLASVAPGGVLRAYVVPQVEIGITLDSVGEERIQTSTRLIAAKRYNVTFANPGSNVAAEVWVDESSRLLRFRVPAQGLEVAREDVASVSSRVERLARDSDERVRIPADGFSLAATMSKPAGPAQPPPARRPAVVLVPGSGPVDRDETVAGISVFAQLAGALSDAGYLVVRYDKRGVGQSGGRDESATVEDYAQDVRAVVKFLEKRKDVERTRIAVVGHSEGGLVGMMAAAQEKKNVAALVMIATPATTGGELVLEQQRYLLDRMNLPADEVQHRVELQKSIQAAVLTGKGWDTIPPAYRRQADTPWFRSFLGFDPARVMPKVSQPILVLQGERDRQVAARHANLLAEMARKRKANRGVDLLIVDGINHLLVPATTGDVEEYQTLQDKHVSPAIIDALTGWLNRTFHVDPARPRQ